MEIRPVYLLVCLIACAYVSAWLVRMTRLFFGWSRTSGVTRRLFGKSKPARLFEGVPSWQTVLVVASGAAFGWAVISWAAGWLVHAWLLLALPCLGLACRELRLSHKDLRILPVLGLLAGLHIHQPSRHDFFDRLARVVDELPGGEVQKAVREALQRRRSGSTVQDSCRALLGLHPYLDEMVFTLRLTGWQATPAFDLALERLIQRTGRDWERLSRTMVLREQMRPLLQFTQAAILVALLYLLLQAAPMLTAVWPTNTTMVWVGVGFLLTAVVFYAADNLTWVQRPVAAVLLAASLIPLWQSASPPHLFNLRQNTITHLTQTTASRLWTSQPTPAVHLPPETPPENQARNTMPDSRPGAAPAVTGRAENRPQPVVTQNKETRNKWLNLCCQPR